METCCGDGQSRQDFIVFGVMCSKDANSCGVFSHEEIKKINDDEKISVTFHYLSLFMIRCFFFFVKGRK